MGVAAMDKTMRGGAIVASFPVELEDQIMLATSKVNQFAFLSKVFRLDQEAPVG